MSHKLVSLYIGEGEYYTRTDADNVIAELNGNIAQLEDDNALLRKNNAELRQENEDLKNELFTVKTDLAMLQRWRKVSAELPEIGASVLISDGFVRKVGALMHDYTWNVDEVFYDVDEYKFWMPMYKAPKDDK